MIASTINKLGEFFYSYSTFANLKQLLLDNKTNNSEFKGYIINHSNFQNGKYFNLTIQIKNECCNEFIYSNEKVRIENGNEIRFTLNNLKFVTINNKCFIEIKNPKIKKSTKKIENYPLNFNIFKFANSYNDIVFNDNNNSYLFSIILKAKEIQNEYNKSIYKFYDIFGENVPVNYLDIKQKIEGQKIYLFSSFKYVKDSKDYFQLTPIKYSTISPIEENNIIYNEDNIINDNEKLITFLGEVKSFSLGKNEIEIIDETQKKLNIRISNNLLKKISLGCKCKFKCFYSNKNNIKSINISDIVAYEKTTILFKFLGKKRYYDQILIDDTIFNLNNEKEMECEINIENNSKNIINKAVKLRNLNNNREISFIIEINRGKQNLSYLYLGSEGKYNYQIYYQANDEKKLPKEFNLMIDGENIKFNNFESFGNKLKKRIILINIPINLLDINNNKFQLEEKKTEENNNIKILKLINDKENEYKFNLLSEDEKKEKIDYKALNINLINLTYSFYNDYYENFHKLYKDSKDIESNKENKYYNLFYGDKNIVKFNNYIKKGFKKFIFNDNEEDYKFMKKVCFAILYYKNKTSDFMSILHNFRDNITYMNELDFIDRIRVMITLVNELSEQKITSEVKVSLADNDLNSNNSIKEAHKIFLDIIDGLTEECALFHAIHQFNSRIIEEIGSKEPLYSGSILNVDDIKLEIYKNLNFFYLISYEPSKLYGAMYDNSKVTILYYNVITNSKFKKNNPRKKKKNEYLPQY